MDTFGNKKVFCSAVIGIIALGSFVTEAQAVPDAPEKWEKCAGVALKGKNDCGALDGSHSCASMASTDRDPNEWAYVPEGTCEKIGGVVKKVVPAKEKAAGDSNGA